VDRLTQAMDSLLGMIDDETTLVRAGRLREAAQISVQKAEFAKSYVGDMNRLAANRPALAMLAPERKNAFRERHAHFQERLRASMTVLATAHAVSEDLIRGVSGELARKAAPQTYGATGRPAYGGPSTIQPLAVSRSL
jgi:hypothetical protein